MMAKGILYKLTGLNRMKFSLMMMLLTLCSCAQLGITKSPQEAWKDLDEGVSQSLEKGYSSAKTQSFFDQLDSVYYGSKCVGPNGEDLDVKVCEQAKTIIKSIPTFTHAEQTVKQTLQQMHWVQQDIDQKTRRTVEQYESYLQNLEKGVNAHENVYKVLDLEVLKDRKFPLSKSFQYIQFTFSSVGLTTLQSMIPVVDRALSVRKSQDEDKEKNIKRCESYEKSIDALGEEHKNWEEMYSNLKSAKDKIKFQNTLENWGTRYQQALYDKKWKGCPSNKIE